MQSGISVEEFVQSICLTPTIYVGNEDYNRVVAYLSGADYALATFSRDAHGFLDGFSEWLDLDAGTRRSLSWQVRVADESLPSQERLRILSEKFVKFRNAVKVKGVMQLKQDHSQRFDSK